jgi:N-acetylneuraminic acid mutarotase
MKGKSINPALRRGAAVRVLCLMSAALALVACGHNSSTPAGFFTVGGTISGLTKGDVVLVYNGSTTVTIAPGATTWIFPGSFPGSSSFAVTVLTQPAGELCAVTSGGTGTTLTADISDVTVTCSVYGQWIWEGGSNSVNAVGTYGTKGVAAASNQPGARYNASSWTDSSGNMWLFAGYGYASSGVLGALNDLWEYSPSSGLWTWVSGGDANNASGVYGTQGTGAASNQPGARQAAISWTDSSGNFWLFGGVGYDSTGVLGELNDLWQYSPGSGQWTWISGANAVNATGIYGTEGTAASANAPGARQAAGAWADASGLWLFGGFGYDSAGSVGNLNDLWHYSLTSGQWTWVNGSQLRNASGMYGTQSVAAANNQPGARQAASSWIDLSGTLWLFGGNGYDSQGNVGDLNDLWQYSASTGQWTWVNGLQARNAGGAYGTQGTPAATNQPGARQAASSWIDSSTGTLWLFGGSGYSSTANGYLNDLWQYNLNTAQWTWISGGNGINAIGDYGKQGTISANAAPGARQAANAWIGSAGTLWLFGGAGFSSSTNGYLNDLWQYVPP